MGIEAWCKAVVAFFVVELELRYNVVVGFDAQAVQHVAAAELHENAAIAVFVVEWEQFAHVGIDVHAARIHEYRCWHAEVVGDVTRCVYEMIKQAGQAHVVREPEVGLKAHAPVALELIPCGEPHSVEITKAFCQVAAWKRSAVVDTHHRQRNGLWAGYLGIQLSKA